MKLAIDIHGVIDKIDLSDIIGKLYDAGNEIFIMTGMHWSQEASDYLLRYGFIKDINFNNYLSVADYHKELGTPMRYDEKNRPWLDPEAWNCTKSQLCYDYDIDVLIDDSAVYARYFDEEHCTQYILFNKETILDDINTIKDIYITNDPYIVVKKIVFTHKYNPNYKKDAICTCGHKYIDHFDSFDKMAVTGCNKCICGTFRLKEN